MKPKRKKPSQLAQPSGTNRRYPTEVLTGA
jgi:hypothetical protein